MEPKDPIPPFILEGAEYPDPMPGEMYTPMAAQDMRVLEAEALDRKAMSGPLGHGPFGMEGVTGRSREAYERCLEKEAATRAVHGGLHDAPADIAPSNPGAYSKVR